MSSLKTTNILHPSSASNNIVLDSSGNIAVQAGTAGAPAIQANGDSNTGIYFPAADNIGFTTGGTIRGRWTTDGLCFNADTAAGNALDDYEEGTWTPNVGGTATYGTQVGIYTKIGRQVLVSFDIEITTLGTGSTTTISGLPFTVSNSPNGESRGATGYFASLATNVIAINCYANANTTTIKFISANASTGTATINPAIFGNSARIQGSVAYIV